MDLTGILLVQTLATIATIVVFSFGLAIVFGMMRVINLAHGEFIMLGGYAAVIARQNGIELWIAILLVPPLAVGLFGVVVERLLMRRLYERPTDTLLGELGPQPVPDRHGHAGFRQHHGGHRRTAGRHVDRRIPNRPL